MNYPTVLVILVRAQLTIYCDAMCDDYGIAATSTETYEPTEKP